MCRATPPNPKRRAAPTAPPAAAPKPYHHGDLRRVLIDAALQLVERGRRRGGQRPRGRPPRRRLAGRAVPAFSEPRCPDDRRWRRKRSGAFGPRSRRRWQRRRPTIRWRRFRCLGWPICAGRCATRPISRSSPAAGFSITTRRPSVSRDNAELIELTERTLAEAFAAGPAAHGRPEAGPDRRPRAGLWLCPDEHRRPFSALGRGGGRSRADRGSDHRPLH